MTRHSWFRQFLLNQKFDNRFDLLCPDECTPVIIGPRPDKGANTQQTVAKVSTLRALVSIFSFCISDLNRILNWN